MIKFGTDGWRAVIAREFSVENVERVCAATAHVFKKNRWQKIAVGYDNRFLAERFARQCADQFKAYGFSVILSSTAIPTPALSRYIPANGCHAGIMLTASHNPYRYLGYKIKTATGASAPQALTNRIEAALTVHPRRKKNGSLKTRDLLAWYRATLKKMIRPHTDMKIVIDAMYGSAAGLFTQLLPRTTIIPVRDRRDPLFDFQAPEPVPKYLTPLSKAVRAKKADLGIAFDGDGDRIALCDETGKIYSAQQTFLLLAWLEALHARQTAGKKIVQAVSASLLTKKICEEYNLVHVVTPVGFKYIADQINAGNVLIGGEESGGIGYDFPERDAPYTALKLISHLETTRMSLKTAWKKFAQKYGNVYYDRIDVPLKKPVKRLTLSAAKVGLPTASLDTTDGLKFILPDLSWLLFRPSGTEPLLRIYAEARTKKHMHQLLKIGITQFRARNS